MKEKHRVVPTSCRQTIPVEVTVGEGDAVGVALSELLPVNVGEGVLDAVPLYEGVLERVIVADSEGRSGRGLSM